MEYIPYTYLIGWSSLNLWYYGSKYANDANPETLWKSYFTSSNKVKYMREKYGEPDVIQIRKTFKDAKSCTSWEYCVLKKLLSKQNTNRHIWINQNVGFGEFYKENNVPEYLSYKRNEYLANRTDEQKQRDYESRLRGAANEEGRRKNSEKAIARYKDPEYKAKMQKIWDSEAHKAIRSKVHSERQNKPEYKEKMHNIMMSEEINKKISENTKKAVNDPLIKKKHKESLAKYNADPENRKKKSELAKASSANRIATRYLNSLSSADLKNITFDEICNNINTYYKGAIGFDIERLRLKYKIKID